MGRIEFPNEPIRVVDPTRVGGYAPIEDEISRHYDMFGIYDEPEDDVDYCIECDGDGWIVCDGGIDCPEADDAGCPFPNAHTYLCTDCGGRGTW